MQMALASMRILIAHVRYRQAGGEDAVFATETALLRKAGEEVAVLDFSGEHFDQLRATTKVAIAANYSDHAFGRRLMAEAVERFRPDVVHFHNVYPILGPGSNRRSAAARLRDGADAAQLPALVPKRAALRLR